MWNAGAEGVPTYRGVCYPFGASHRERGKRIAGRWNAEQTAKDAIQRGDEYRDRYHHNLYVKVTE